MASRNAVMGFRDYDQGLHTDCGRDSCLDFLRSANKPPERI